jgi:hypothetical protein
MSSIADLVAPAAAAAAADAEDGLEEPEAKRWLLLLGVPFVVGGALFGLSIATDQMWMLVLAAAFGPGAMILGFTYLALSHDGNLTE